MTNSCDTSKGASCGSKPNPENTNSKQHWENVYAKTDHSKLGWFEENPQPSLDLIAKCKLKSDAKILNVGAGATTLVDKLLDLNLKF